ETFVFDGRGTELDMFSGYIPPPRMASLRRAVVDDPTPGPSAEADPAAKPSAGNGITEDLRWSLDDLLVERYDNEHGGGGFAQKVLDLDAVEDSLLRRRAGGQAAPPPGPGTPPPPPEHRAP